MIKGTVTEEGQATVKLRVYGKGGKTRTLTFLVDTGFSGWLSLQPKTIRELGLRWWGETESQVADGRDVTFQVYRGYLHWEGRKQPLEIYESETSPLVGMGVLHGNELRIQVKRGGKVVIKPLK